MKMNWNGHGRKLSLIDNQTSNPVVLEWHRGSSENVYCIWGTYARGHRELLFMRIPDYAWQSTSPSFWEGKNDSLRSYEASAIFSAQKGSYVSRVLSALQKALRLRRRTRSH